MRNLANLEIFAAVGSQRSFTRAAEHLGLPKSAVSRRIKELESELGVRLINRDSRRFELTDHGAVLLEGSTQLLRQTEQVMDQVRAVQKGLRGTLSISTTVDLAQQILLGALAAYRLENPEVHVHLDVTPQMQDLLSQRFDLAIRLGPLKDSGLVARKLFDRSLGFFASQDYLKGNRRPERVEDLAEHSLIVTSRRAIAAMQLQAAIEVNSMGLVRDLVLRGAGIGLIDPAIIPLEQKSALVPLLPRVAVPNVGIYLVFPHNKPPRRVTELVKKILQHRPT